MREMGNGKGAHAINVLFVSGEKLCQCVLTVQEKQRRTLKFYLTTSASNGQRENENWLCQRVVSLGGKLQSFHVLLHLCSSEVESGRHLAFSFCWCILRCIFLLMEMDDKSRYFFSSLLLAQRNL